MHAALNEAKKALGQTSPNPAVGAVLVVGDRIVSRGHHRGAGREHAEVECLRNFGAPLPAASDALRYSGTVLHRRTHCFHAQMRYFKRESETSLSARLT